MSSIEINKYVGAILGACLLALTSGLIAEGLTAVHTGPESPVYVVESTDSEESADPAEAEAGGEVPPLGTLLAAADSAAGEKAAKKCKACHTFDQGGATKIGPNLWNVIGAKKAGTAGFSYSAGFGALEGSWAFEDLDAFLTSPKSYVTGTKMVFVGLKDAVQRANMIAYLRGLSDSPAPLPDAE
ncbi:MAG: cytochrome c family protein [Alphaproteobacteria bacterium]|jgi:cytochrome c|nr:cytochrome c family protein [Alphaproteobacteria bacterium]MDP6515920.1 cytochrome c family protein [Alphaproteobacteria bacterium]